MVRYNVFLRLDQLKRLRKIAKRTGVKVAERIRRGVDREIEACEADAVNLEESSRDNIFRI